MSPIRMQTPQSVRIIEVIEVRAARGAGTDADEVRIVKQYWSRDGDLLAENDPAGPSPEGGTPA